MAVFIDITPIRRTTSGQLEISEGRETEFYGGKSPYYRKYLANNHSSHSKSKCYQT